MHILLFLRVKLCFSAFCLVSAANDDLLCASRGGCAVSLSDDSGGAAHSDAIRAITFGAGGGLFASAGDDKLVKVWKTRSWRCIRTM
jgi:tRNA (guanine-N(7)-)-methyltransferase subunit TRM82